MHFPRGTPVWVKTGEVAYPARVVRQVKKLDNGSPRYVVQNEYRQMFIQNPRDVTLREEK